MEWKDIDLPGFGGAYFISQLWRSFTIRLIYTQAVNFLTRRKKRQHIQLYIWF